MTSPCCWRLSTNFAVTILYAPVSRIVTYIAGKKKEEIFLSMASGMCFCFHALVCSCIPFPCVVRDGEIAGE